MWEDPLWAAPSLGKGFWTVKCRVLSTNKCASIHFSLLFLLSCCLHFCATVDQSLELWADTDHVSQHSALSWYFLTATKIKLKFVASPKTSGISKHNHKCVIEKASILKNRTLRVMLDVFLNSASMWLICISLITQNKMSQAIYVTSGHWLFFMFPSSSTTQIYAGWPRFSLLVGLVIF